MAIDALPKAELHLHLEGSIRPDTALKLAARHGVTLTPEEVAARYNFSNFNGFLETFKWVTSYLRTPDDYALITRQLCEELVRQHVVYAEFTISAGVILRRMQNLEATVAAIRDAAQSVPFARLRTAFILDAARQFGPDPAKEVARWAAKLQKLGVVSFGMGGDELAYPTVNFRPAFDLARQDGLHIVCHAGEIGGPDSVREAIELLGAERIGHGIAVMRDAAFADTLAMRRVVLEVCPTSNMCTGSAGAASRESGGYAERSSLAGFCEAWDRGDAWDGRSGHVPHRFADGIFESGRAGRFHAKPGQADGAGFSFGIFAAG